MTNYPSNLSDSQWQVMSKYFDCQRNRRYELREIINAILYIIKTGCQWRMLPKDFAPWQLVYYYFNTWKKQEVFNLIQESLVQKTRLKQGKAEQPTVGIIDAQSVKSTLVSSESKGFDAGKRIKGIKRHIIVDTLGMILAVVIQGASVQDRNGAMDVMDKLFETWNRIIKIFADYGYRGTLVEKVKTKFKAVFEVIKRTESHTFKILPKRWIVERTFAWIDTNRRAAKNYERFNDTSVAIVHLSAIRIMLNRF
jgi:putative transposase